jgi:hypothetical protein
MSCTNLRQIGKPYTNLMLMPQPSRLHKPYISLLLGCPGFWQVRSKFVARWRSTYLQNLAAKEFSFAHIEIPYHNLTHIIGTNIDYFALYNQFFRAM